MWTTLALTLLQAGTIAEAVPVVDPTVWVTAGAAIPDLELPRIDGSGSISLASFRGKKLLLVQFASW